MSGTELEKWIYFSLFTQNTSTAFYTYMRGLGKLPRTGMDLKWLKCDEKSEFGKLSKVRVWLITVRMCSNKVLNTFYLNIKCIEREFLELKSKLNYLCFFFKLLLRLIDIFWLLDLKQTLGDYVPASLFATSLPPLARVTLDPSLQARENVNIKKNISYSWNHQKNFSMFLAWRIIHDDFLYDSFSLLFLEIF